MKTLHMNVKGQITIPSNIRKKFGYGEESIFKCAVTPSGEVVLRPVMISEVIDISHKIEQNKALLEEIAESLKQVEAGQTISTDDFLKYLKGETEVGELQPRLGSDVSESKNELEDETEYSSPRAEA